MHDIVVEQFEDHLGGNASRAFYEHLDACADCRAQIALLSDVSSLVQEFRPDAQSTPLEPSLGFYSRVTVRIVEEQRKEAWGLFSPGLLFFRRIAFASLLVLATLGGFLVSHEKSADGADAAAIMAQHDVTADHAVSSDRDRLLVTLASYHE